MRESKAEAVSFGENRERSTARTESPALTAGRALDALVGQRVMGWKKEPTRYKDSDGFTWTAPNGRTHLVWLPLEVSAYMPRYSTDIAAAWEVVGKLREDYHSIRVENRGGPPHDAWWVGIDLFVRDDTWSGGGYYSAEKIFTAEAPAAPLAICLAALRAVSALSQTEEGK